MLIYLHKLNIEIQRGRFLLAMINHILIQYPKNKEQGGKEKSFFFRIGNRHENLAILTSGS